MANVYTERFFSAPGFSGGPTVQYVVPPGFRAVVKTITLVWGDITVSGLDAWVMTADLAKLMRFVWAFGFSTPYNLGGSNLYYGTMAVDPGDSLSTQTQAGACDITASGYLLALP